MGPDHLQLFFPYNILLFSQANTIFFFNSEPILPTECTLSLSCSHNLISIFILKGTNLLFLFQIILLSANFFFKIKQQAGWLQSYSNDFSTLRFFCLFPYQLVVFPASTRKNVMAINLSLTSLSQRVEQQMSFPTEFSVKSLSSVLQVQAYSLKLT